MNSNLQPAPPFGAGNRVAEKHSFYATILTPVEQDDLAEIADALRELSPLDTEALEPLVQLVAGQFWRRRKAYADLEANGVVRTRGKAAPILRDLETLERSILDGIKALALTPQAAASLNLTLSRARSRDRYDTDRLSREEVSELDRLLTKARLSD